MITELTKREFYICKDLLYEQGQIEAKAVIEGINPGRLFVDDRNAPTTGLIWLGNNDGFIFIGDENNSDFIAQINDYIDTVISPEAKKIGLDYFEGVGNHPKWNETIKETFKHRKLGSWEQRVYKLETRDYNADNQPFLAEGYELVKISSGLVNANEIKNISFLHNKIMEFWSSVDHFLTNGIGHCIVYENEIVGACLSGFVVGQVHCIDIETLEGHRGKKLAQNLAHAFVRECLETGCLPYWDCMQSNKPSVAVAENVGFKMAFSYTGFEFAFK